MQTKNKPSFNSKQLQVWLNVMAFFLAFPSIYILQNSVYFYAFIIVLIATKKITGRFLLKNRFTTITLLIFISGTISSIFHPILKFDPGFISKFNIIVHFAYWLAIGAYFASWMKHINIYLLSKWVTIGFFSQVLAFYFLNTKIDLIIIKIAPGISRNGFVFNVICFSGFVLYYLYKKYGKTGLNIGNILILIALLFTNGRAGASISLLIFILSLSVVHRSFKILTKFFLISGIFFLFFSSINKNFIANLAHSVVPIVSKINPRFADLLIGEGEGDLTFDRSWLLRKLMVDKSIEIYKKHPVLGIGWNNFIYYDDDLKTLNDFQYERLQNLDSDYLNTRSAHNSYAQLLAETGTIGIFLLLLLIIPILFKLAIEIINGSNNILILFYISFLAASIHLYVISSITGANFWFLLGVTYGIKNNIK